MISKGRSERVWASCISAHYISHFRTLSQDIKQFIFYCTIVMENNWEKIFYLDSITILRAKFWLPVLKGATKLPPSLVFPHTFFIFYLLVDLFPEKQRHNYLLSKKSIAQVLYFVTVLHTVGILKARIQSDVLLNVSWQSIKVTTVKKINWMICNI